MTQKYVNDLAYKIVGCAIEVHKNLGPGLLESIYEECLEEELKREGLSVKRQVPVPIKYKGKEVGNPLKLDMLVNNSANIVQEGYVPLVTEKFRELPLN